MKVEGSSKKFTGEGDINLADGSKIIKLDELKDLVEHQRVLCEVKVVSVEEVKEVSGGKRIQELLVEDCSGTARLTLWESHIGKMEEGNSYRAKGLRVREFRGNKVLSTSKENCEIEKIDDIGAVVEEGSEEEDNLLESMQVSNSAVA